MTTISKSYDGFVIFVELNRCENQRTLQKFSANSGLSAAPLDAPCWRKAVLGRSWRHGASLPPTAGGVITSITAAITGARRHYNNRG